MTQFTDYQRASHDRLCPICCSNLVLHDDGSGYYLKCTEGHVVNNPWDAPHRSRIEYLRSIGEAVTRHSTAKGQSVEESMRDLFG